MTILVTGGASCGKSDFAERILCALSQERYYLATMHVWGSEEEARIARHRELRSTRGFETLEMEKLPFKVPENASLLLEDLPNWLANEFFDHGSPSQMASELRRLHENCRHLVIVTDDVFCDGKRYSAETMNYLTFLAQLQIEASGLADLVFDVVAGIPVCLKGDASCLLPLL